MSAHVTVPQPMKASRLVEFRKNYTLLHDVPVPKPKPDEVLIRVAAAGFCHTDLMVYHGITQVSLPFIGSHEPAGTIVGLGSDVPEIWHIGDRVGVTNFIDPCQGCNVCKWAMQSLGSLDPRFCDNMTMCGIIRRDGAFAEYMASWHGAVVSLPGSIGFEQAAFLIGVLVAAGFPEHGLKFDPMNLILREIVVKGTGHGSMDETREMMEFVVQHGIRSHLTLLTMDEAEDIAARSEAHAFTGRPDVKIGMH
ncbi:hypothetical protein ACKAV7_004361 [Fusarium commune]